MPIIQIDHQGCFVQPPYTFDGEAEKAAKLLGWPSGTWRVITPEEAAALQAPTPEELAARRIAEIRARLSEIDAQSIRPSRAINNGTATDDDRARLAGLESEAEALRAELQAIMPE